MVQQTKKSVLLALSDQFAEVPYAVLKYRLAVLIVIACVTAIMVYAIATRTSLDMTIESFLDPDDPAMHALNQFREQFGSDDSIFLVYRARDGDIFSRQSMAAVQQLTHDLRNWQSLDRSDYAEDASLQWDELKHIRRVLSIANIRYEESSPDSLVSRRLVPRQLPELDEQLASIGEKALSLEDYLLAFYSKDQQYGAILIQTDFGTKPVEGFVSAIDDVDLSLDDSFASFDDDLLFEVEFDETVEVQKMEFEAVDMTGYNDFHRMTSALYEKYDNHFEFFPVGNPPLLSFMFNLLLDMQALGALLVVVFAVLLWILFRSFSAVLWPLITILLCLVWTFGFPALIGVKLSLLVVLTIMLVFAVGIADCVHVMSAYFTFRRDGDEHHQALSKAYGKTGLAILLTTVTTMCGVMALAISDLALIQVFGWSSALGVLMALFFTMALLPILLDLWHPGSPEADASLIDNLGKRWLELTGKTQITVAAVYFIVVFTALGPAVGAYISIVTLLTYVVVNWQKPILAKIPGIASRYPYLIMALFAAIFLTCLYGMSLIRIDSNMTKIARDGSALQKAYNTVDQHMAGSQSVEIVVNTNVVDGLKNPQVLRAIDELQTRIEARYPTYVPRTNSLANIVKQTNKIMHDDDPAFYRIPDSELMVSQLLYLFNSANPEDRRALVSDDYSQSHITINAYNAGSDHYQAFFIEIGEEIDETFGNLETEFPDLQVDVTGTMAMMLRMADELAWAQYTSLLLALAIISMIMIFTLGSFQGGLLAMIPNLIPAVLSFGLMGLLGMPLDADTLLIAPIIIGIAVDDTIHFMTHYRLDLARTRSISKALTSTIQDVGQAVMFTTMIIALSFAILSFSGHMGMAKMGFFGSIAIVFALLCDLFFLPAMIITFKPTFGMKDADTTIDFSRSAQPA